MRSVFCKAANIIREVGWVQDTYRMDGGPVCIVGAINLACGLNPEGVAETSLTEEEKRRRWDLSDNAVRYLYVKLNCGPISWNDMPGRKKEEVLALLDEECHAGD